MRANDSTKILPSASLPQTTVKQQITARSEVARYRKLLARRPDDITLLCRFASNLIILEQYDIAETAYIAAIKSAPTCATLCAYAALLAKTQRHAEAIQIWQTALLQTPEDHSIYNHVGMSFQAIGKLDQALEAYRHMLALSPGNAVAYNNIGTVLQAQSQFHAALENYHHALLTTPNFDIAHLNLGCCLMLLGWYEAALASFKDTIKLNPTLLQAHINVTAMQNRLGLLEDAITSCKQTLKLDPTQADIHSNMLFMLSHSTRIDAATLFVEQLNFAVQFEAPWRATWPQHANERDPERVLRIGFISGDLNSHAVMNFLAPILDHLVHASTLELVIYCNNNINDSVTAQLRASMPQWHDIMQLSDTALVRKIQDDAIDVLIDLSGHSAYNRLPVFARKPAPLQLTWIGCPTTTGLQAMDYYVTDYNIAPPGMLDNQFSEKLLRLPASAPFMPDPNAPVVSAAPASKNGYITFGSFNRPNKISTAVINRWSALLKAVPTAHLVLGAMPSDKICNTLREAFINEGIASERLHFYLNTHMGDYLALHSLVDVCVDTFPYAGGTTTFHALWMGVPTLTMAGSALPSRVGACILSHVNLPDFIAQDEADFLNKGNTLADSLDYLATLRAGMRARVSNSALGQPALIAAGLDNGLRSIWRRWCAGLPPASFNADPTQSSLSQRAASLQSLHDVNVDAALLLAIEHHQGNRLVEAETLYLAILHNQPLHAIANHNMGLLANQLGFPNEALPYLAAAHAATPNETQFCLSYAQCLQRMGQAAHALEVVSAAMGHGPDDVQLQAFLLQIQASEENQQPSGAEAEHIFTLYQASQYDKMEAATRAMVARYPHSGFAWSVLGTALQVQSKDALAVLQMAVKLEPQDAQAHGNLGNAWQDAAQYATAIASYQQALALDPTFADAYCNMASAQHALGLLADATLSYRNALEIAPDNAVALHNLSILLQDGAACGSQI